MLLKMATCFLGLDKMVCALCMCVSLCALCVSVCLCMHLTYIYKYTKKLGITRVGTIVDRKKVLKRAGVVHNIKSQ